MNDKLRDYSPKLVHFLRLRNNGLKDEKLQHLSGDAEVNIGDVIFEIRYLARDNKIWDIVAYQLSAERGYLEGESDCILPPSRFYTEAVYRNRAQFNGAFGINFGDISNKQIQQLRPLKIQFTTRKTTKRYLHTSIRIDSNTLSSGRFFRLNTPEKGCTYDLVARVIGYIPR